YLLESDGEEQKVWNGSESEFSHENLDADTPYSYKIRSYDSSGEVKDYIIINTSTLDKENKVESLNNDIQSKSDDKGSKIYFPMENSKLNVMYNSDFVFLSWKNIPTDNDSYEVYKNGELLDVVNGTEYTDENISKNETYQYTVIGNKEIPKDAQFIKLKEIDKEMSDLSKDEKKGLFYEPKQASAIIHTSEKSAWNGINENTK